MQITAPLTINNGAATPVAKTFSPERVGSDTSVFAERSAPASAGFTRLTVGFSAANGKRATNRVDIKLDFPVLSTVNGVSSVAYTGRFQGYFVIPDVMTSAERADLAAYVANALDVTAIRATVKDLDPIWG